MKSLTKRINRVLAVLLTTIALTVGQGHVWAASTWTVTNDGNVFTITRSESGTAETVKYRTISLTALADQHFTETNGTLEFAADEVSKQVTVTETAVSDLAVKYRYQTSTSRSYRFEVLNTGGAELAHCDRAIEYGSSYKIELEKFFKNIEIKVFSNDVTVDDVCYGS